MTLPWKKTEIALPATRNVRTVSELVNSFTRQFKEVADAHIAGIAKQEAIIEAAQTAKTFAEAEK